MKTKFHISCFYFFLFTFKFSSALLFAVEPNATSTDAVRIKMLHIFIQADVNDVRFDNIWVFENQQRGEPWQAGISLPDHAVLLDFNEPNEIEFVAESSNLRKKMAADSIIGYMDFSFVLPNRGGLCRTSIKPGYQVNSMAVSVSGPATQLKSDILKFHSSMASRDRLPRVYTAGNLAPKAKIDINLSRLPRKNSKMSQVICVAGLALIVTAALFTIYYNRVIKAGREPPG